MSPAEAIVALVPVESLLDPIPRARRPGWVLVATDDTSRWVHHHLFDEDGRGYRSAYQLLRQVRATLESGRGLNLDHWSYLGPAEEDWR